jgi:uncharacterized protein (DUF433 family)
MRPRRTHAGSGIVRGGGHRRAFRGAAVSGSRNARRPLPLKGGRHSSKGYSHSTKWVRVFAGMRSGKPLVAGCAPHPTPSSRRPRPAQDERAGAHRNGCWRSSKWIRRSPGRGAGKPLVAGSRAAPDPVVAASFVRLRMREQDPLKCWRSSEWVPTCGGMASRQRSPGAGTFAGRRASRCGRLGAAQEKRRGEFVAPAFATLVPEIGFEPTTYALRMRRSTS